jgi:radical SAM superfamily enzyme YgiQ (UPF0313 family)
LSCEAPLMPLKIALLSPRGPLYRHRGGIFKKSLRYMPLTLPTLASLIPADLEHHLTLHDEGNGEIPLELEADLIGISAITGSAPRAYELADHFRRQGKCVVLGGVHPTLLPEEAARHADSVVIGYAEESWPQLLRDFSSGVLKASYRQTAGLKLGGRGLPRRDLLPNGSLTVGATIEATRGCLHQCSFCVVPSAWGRPLQHPVCEVIEDIRSMRSRRILFLDLNLIADKDYAKELFQAQGDERLEWGGLVTTQIAWDEELLELAAQSGCRGLLIGFESLTPEALRECKKGFNLLRDYEEVIARLHERRIALMGTFVFGFDHDSVEVFSNTVDFVLRNRIELPRYAVLTPFPGTPLHRHLSAQERLLHRDWSLYDGQHVVFEPARMSPQDLQRGTEWAWRKTYSYGGIARRLWKGNLFLAALMANLGYRFYAYRLHQYYNCRSPLLVG